MNWRNNLKDLTANPPQKVEIGVNYDKIKEMIEDSLAEGWILVDIVRGNGFDYFIFERSEKE